MRISIKTTKWYEDAYAACVIFTKLPLSKLYRPSPDSYSRAIAYWPLTGWLTGPLMAAVLYFSDMILPYQLAVILAVATRMLLTGTMYERRMRDFINQATGNHLYGNTVWALYELLLFACLCALNTESAAMTIIAADPFAKMISGQIIQMLPHAPQRSDERPQIAFQKLCTAACLPLFFFVTTPLLASFYIAEGERWDLILFLPCIAMYFQYLLILKTRRGYSDESLGMLFLLNELTVYLVVTLQAIL